MSNKRFIEVAADASQKVYYFQQDPVLQQSSNIEMLEVFRAGKVALSPRSGATVIPDAVFNKAFLTLVVGEEEKISKIPLTLLCRADNNGFVLPLNYSALNITKCYIEVPELTSVVTGNVFFLIAHYK